jgi:biotin synthase
MSWRLTISRAGESFLTGLKNRVLSGYEIDFDEALEAEKVIDDDNLSLAVRLANEVREHFLGNKADLCSITNARSGMCEQDCKFCSQSVHNSAQIDIYPMRQPEDLLEDARRAEKIGAHRFCLVTSGKNLSDEEFEIALKTIELIKSKTSLKRCASLGSITKIHAKALKDAGLNRYHHNVETARSNYPNLCSTQNYEEKMATIETLTNADIEVCCGGIFNVGENNAQRIEMAFEIKELAPVSVPINFLNPRQGTPLENQPPIDATEAIKFLAVYRFILPRQIIRLAAGRCETFDCLQEKAVQAGVNGLLIGDYLTTSGPDWRKDLKMLIGLGFSVKND